MMQDDFLDQITEIIITLHLLNNLNLGGILLF